MYAIDVEEVVESLADMAKILERAAKELRAGKTAGAGWKILEVEPEEDDEKDADVDMEYDDDDNESRELFDDDED